MKPLRPAVLLAAAALTLSGCGGFTPYDLPLPGGADTGDDPYRVTVQFTDALDLVQHSSVKVDEVAVGRVVDVELQDWTALVTVELDGSVDLPENAQATIRQSSLLGEKFVSLAAPEEGAEGRLEDGDHIPLENAGRNPEIEEVLAAASMVLNGGALDRTNTIVKELNLALEGNGDDVKQLVRNATTFVGQLDANKAEILETLEKVNALAERTNEQEEQITTALEELPEALEILEQQRGDIVTLMTELDELGDVATGVVRESKADTVANLKHLAPTLRALADSGDSLADASSLVLSFPFADAFVGGTVASASAPCTSNSAAKNKGACNGDYGNLSLRLDVGADQLDQFLAGLSPTSAPDLANVVPEPLSEPAKQLADILGGLIPQQAEGLQLPSLGGLLGGAAKSRPATPTPTPTPTATAKPTSGSLNPLCWLGLCRVAPTSGAGAPSLDDFFTKAVTAP